MSEHINLADENGLAEKVFLAFANFVIGSSCVALALISLSIVPDCAGSISGQVLTYFVVQCVVELAALLITTFSVSYMLAVNDGIFINEAFEDVPGQTIVVCLITATCLQFFSSVYKNLEVICPGICAKVFNKIVTFLTIVGSFILASNRFIDDIFAKRTLKFKLDKLRWIYNLSPDNFWLNIFLGTACLVLTILCLLAIIRVLMDNFLLAKDQRYIDKFDVCKNTASMLLMLITDLVYAILVFYSNFRTSSNVGNRMLDANPFGLKMPRVESNNFDGYIQGYIVFIWPVVAMIINYKRVRTVIKIRSDLMISRTQMPRARPTSRRSITKKFSTIETIESVNNLIDTSQNSLPSMENSSRKKISTISQVSIPDTPTRKNSQYVFPDANNRKPSMVITNQWAGAEVPPRHKISTITQYSIPERLNKRMSQYSISEIQNKRSSVMLIPQTSYTSQEYMYM